MQVITKSAISPSVLTALLHAADMYTPLPLLFFPYHFVHPVGRLCQGPTAHPFIKIHF